VDRPHAHTYPVNIHAHTIRDFSIPANREFQTRADRSQLINALLCHAKIGFGNVKFVGSPSQGCSHVHTGHLLRGIVAGSERVRHQQREVCRGDGVPIYEGS
jgi:hypothetical protein